MAQHDYSIANQGFPAFRSDLNNGLAAIVSNNSGATEPTTMFAHQIWVDTAANPSILKIRNADNDAWITIGSIDQTGDTFTMVNLKTSGPVVFNDAGADVDFRVESDTVDHALFVEGSSGNVGIGTSSPAVRLDVQAPNCVSSFTSTTGTNLVLSRFINTGGTFFVGREQSNGANFGTAYASLLWSTGAYPMQFATNDLERARITSGGYFKASDTGTYTNATGNFHELGQSANQLCVIVRGTNASFTNSVLEVTGDRTTTNATYNIINAYNGNVTGQFLVRDSGNVLNTNNSYGQISDIKTKQDIVDAGSQWDDIKNIRVRKFRFKTDPTGFLQIGVVAQELEEVSPGLVEESPDYEEVTRTREVEKTREVTPAVLDEDGNEIEPAVTETYTEEEEYTEREPTGTVTKAVKYSILYMKAVKALQEAMERIETLEAKVAALEAK